jgi:predicted DNA-binding transcriptional regulator AlpA
MQNPEDEMATTEMACQIEDDLVTAKMACHIIGGRSTPINLATFYRGIAAGRYPPGIAIGAQGKRWKRSELIAVIERAASERRFDTAIRHSLNTPIEQGAA